jgi:hypothetical protein
MKKATDKVLASAYQMYKDGAKQKEVLSLLWNPNTGKPTKDAAAGETLNYSQFWLYCQAQDLPADAFITASEGSDEWFEAITKCRNAGDSWGLIAVKCRRPEGRIRKAFTEATGLRSQGLRIGHGGRYLDHDPVLYVGEAKVTGTAIPATAKRAEFRDFVTTGIENLPHEEKVRRARLHGFKVTAKTSEKLLVKMLQDPAGVKAAQANRKATKNQPQQENAEATA